LISKTEERSYIRPLDKPNEELANDSLEAVLEGVDEWVAGKNEIVLIKAQIVLI
jgi:hypothetical protein